VRARDLMRRDLAVRPDESLDRAARLMASAGVGEIPVADRGRLVGVLAERDLAAAHPSAATTLSVGEIRGWLDRVPVRKVMATGATAVGPDTPVVEAIRLMRAKHLTAVPVVRDDQLVGLVTRSDVLAVLEGLLGQGADR
jgi:acetoin utilization protein AcuB